MRRPALPDPARRLLVYAALAVAITWPLARDPAGFVVGAPRSDAWNSLWGLWFVAHHGPLPTWTNLLDFPEGGRIAVADPLNALLALPLTRLAGPVVAYAAVVLGHLAVGGWAADRLGRAMGGHGWIAGVGWQLAPVALANLHDGASEAASTAWLPLAALALLAALRRGGAGRVALAGLALAVTAIGGWYAGVGAALLGLGLFLVGFEGIPFRVRAARLVPAGLVALAVALPVARAERATALADDGLVDIKQAADLARIRRTLGAADPRTLVVPGDFRSPDFAHLQGNPSDYVHTAYLGWALLVLAVLGARRRPGTAGAWVFAIVGGVVLALGPVVVVDGHPLALGARGLALPLPYRLLEGLPGFDSLSLLYRLVGVSSLGLAVLADRLHPAWALAVAAEVLLASPVRGLPAVSPVPEKGALAAMDGTDGAVMNLPPTASRAYLYEQVLHGHPIVGSLNTGINRAGLEVARAARHVREGEAPPEALAEAARAQGVRWAVIHRDVLMQDEWIEVAGALRRFGTVAAEDDRYRVVRLYDGPSR